MDTIRDCTGRIVCKANASNGLIETKYCKLKIFVTITIGSTYTVIRDGITTQITRVNERGFSVSSAPTAA